MLNCSNNSKRGPRCFGRRRPLEFAWNPCGPGCLTVFLYPSVVAQLYYGTVFAPFPLCSVGFPATI